MVHEGSSFTGLPLQYLNDSVPIDPVSLSDSIAYNVYHKLTQVVRHARVSAQPSDLLEDDLWFDTQTQHVASLRDCIEYYQGLSSKFSWAKPFRLQVLLRVPKLKPQDVLVYAGDFPSASLISLDPPPTHILVETWSIDYVARVAREPKSYDHNKVYQHCTALFRSLFTLLRVLPAWKLESRLNKHLSSSKARFELVIRVQGEELGSSVSGDTPRSNDAGPVYDLSPLPKGSHNFPVIPHATGDLSVHVNYLENPVFQVIERDKFISDRLKDSLSNTPISFSSSISATADRFVIPPRQSVRPGRSSRNSPRLVETPVVSPPPRQSGDVHERLSRAVLVQRSPSSPSPRPALTPSKDELPLTKLAGRIRRENSEKMAAKLIARFESSPTSETRPPDRPSPSSLTSPVGIPSPRPSIKDIRRSTQETSSHSEVECSSLTSDGSFAVVNLPLANKCKITIEEIEESSLCGFESSEDAKIALLLRVVLCSQVEDKQCLILDLTSHDAQCALDAIQNVLDSASFETLQLPPSIDPRTVPHRLRRLLLKLAIRSDQLPRPLHLSDLRLLATNNYAGLGGFSDIFHGMYGTERVAIKRLRVFELAAGSKRPGIKHMFYHEAITWRNLCHRHILPFLGIDEQLFPSAFCMVSPWMQNGSVRHTIDVMKTELNVPNQELFGHVQRWARETVFGLAYLHQENVVHGDLRCANILLDGDLEVKLADFGLSVFADGASNNYASTRAGATRWLAPELIEPGEFDKSSSRPTFMSDVYSYACVLIELYTGSAPFAELSEFTVIRRVMSGSRPERPRFHDGDYMSSTLWSLVSKSWCQMPSDRPSADCLVQALASMDA